MPRKQEIASLKFVGHADTEAAARRWLDADGGRWSLAIVDLFLAGGSCFGRLKDCHARQPGQKTVVLTASIQPDIPQHCREPGADAVFDKSHDVDKLVDFCKAHAASPGGMAHLAQ